MTENRPLSPLFVAAPFSSLNPLLAAGWFAGIAEALIRRPRVEDFEQLGDITTLKNFFLKKRIFENYVEL